MESELVATASMAPGENKDACVSAVDGIRTRSVVQCCIPRPSFFLLQTRLYVQLYTLKTFVGNQYA